MRFRYTILFVSDVVGTIQFYEQAFGLEQGMLHESGDYGELATGETKLAFSSQKLMAEIGKPTGPPNPVRPSFEIAMETNDVAMALQRALSAGATLVQDVQEMAWGQTTAYVRDINDYLVEICTPISN
ncbi:MAG: VOC family protein [Planctomycetota bacterium]